MKNEPNSRILHDICPKNTFFLEFWGQFAALKLRVSVIDPNTNYVIMVDIVLRAQSMLNKLFLRLIMLLYGISLDAQSCDTDKKRKFSNRPIFLLNNNGFNIIPPGSHNPAGIPVLEIPQSRIPGLRKR